VDNYKHGTGSRSLRVPGPPAEAGTIIGQFLSERLEASGASGFVLGLSGGLDSALALAIAAGSVGPQRVKAVFMPYGGLSRNDLAFALSAADAASVELEKIDITASVDAHPFKVEGTAHGNLQARIRMCVLYSIANTEGRLVLGTSNKTELMLGYFTKFGDGGSDLCPLGDLLKTQVRTLAATEGVPHPIIERPPTAALAAGQTDEGDLGMPYTVLDPIIIGYLHGMDPDSIADALDLSVVTPQEKERSGIGDHVDAGDVRRVIAMIRSSMHKRDALVIPKIGPDTIGIDLRERW